MKDCPQNQSEGFDATFVAHNPKEAGSLATMKTTTTTTTTLLVVLLFTKEHPMSTAAVRARPQCQPVPTRLLHRNNPSLFVWDGTCDPRRWRQSWTALSLCKSHHHHHHHHHHHAVRLFQCRGGGDGDEKRADPEHDEETNLDLETVHKENEEEGPSLERESNVTSDKEETSQESAIKSSSAVVNQTNSTTSSLEPQRPASLVHSPLLRTSIAAAATAITLAIASIPPLNKFLLQSGPVLHMVLVAIVILMVERILVYVASLCAKLWTQFWAELSDDSRRSDEDWVHLKPKRRKRTKVIYVERRHDSFQSGFSAGFEKGRKSSTQRRLFSSRPKPRRRPQPACASRMTTRASSTSDDLHGPKSSPRSSNTMLHNLFTAMRENVDSDTKSGRDRRPRHAPLAHSWTLGRSKVDSTSPLPSSDSTEKPRTMFGPALELLRQKQREQETQSD
jgi:hypothetical protein